MQTILDEEPRGGFFNPALFGLSGLELMQLSARGEGGVPPPLSYLTGMKFEEAGPGTATFRMPATGWLASPAGVFIGGSVAMVADAALGCAVMTGLPPATPYTTQELTLNYLRPASVSTGALIARGRLIHLGRSLGLSEALVEDANGKLLAHGSSRCFIFEQVQPVPPRPNVVETPAQPVYDTPHPYQRPPEGALWPEEVWSGMTGLEVQRAAIAGKLPPPPMHHLMGIACVTADEGASTWTMPASGWLCSPTGNLQGGTIAMLADCTIGNTIGTTLPAGTAYASVDLKVNFLRPAPPDGSNLLAHGRVTHRGKNVAIADAEVVNVEGKRVALARGSAVILPGRSASLEPIVVSDDATSD